MTAASSALQVALARDLELQPPEQRWLIQGLWSHQAVGIIGGTPKCCKTWLGLDMAISVASGTHALDLLPVDAPGPVLIYLAEDALPTVRSRIDALCHHRGLDIGRLDLHVITEPGLRLDLQQDQERLQATIERIRPRLLLLDPLVRIHALDENSASEISWLLGYFRRLQRSYRLAIALVHHASKTHRAQPGQALRGSSDLHAWGDTNAYLSRRDQHLTLSIEHRAASSPLPLTLELVSSKKGNDTHLAAVETDSVPQDLTTADPETAVLRILGNLSQPMTRTLLRSLLRIQNERLGQVLQALEQRGKIRRTRNGWLASPPNDSKV